MAHPQAARRYAKALFELAVGDGRDEAVYRDLAALRDLCGASDDLRRFLGDALLPPERRLSALRALFEGRVDELTFRFLAFLDARKRLGLLREIAAAYGRLYDERRGVIEAGLTSAHPLTAEQQAALTRRLESRLGKKVRATAAVDPALLGGFQVQIDDQILDYSVETQLQTLNRSLVNA